MSCSTLTPGPLRAASTLHPTQLLWTHTHLLSNTDTAPSYVHSLAITTVLCCPFIAPSDPNMITALHLVLHLPDSFFSPHTIPDSVFSLGCSVTQCRSPPVYLPMLIASVMY